MLSKKGGVADPELGLLAKTLQKDASKQHGIYPNVVLQQHYPRPSGTRALQELRDGVIEVLSG